MSAGSFSRPLAAVEIRALTVVDITTTPAEREEAARRLQLPAIGSLEAHLVAAPFDRDGLTLSGEVRARITEICVLSAEPFETDIVAPVEIRFSPRGCDPNAPLAPGEMLDPDAEDPPDLLVGGSVDLADVICEFLALALDPYPRKPGTAFEGGSEAATTSPFAALAALKRSPGQS